MNMMRRMILSSGAHRHPSIPHQRRYIFSYVAAHPEETMMILGSALAVSIFRIFMLEVKTRGQIQTIEVAKKQGKSQNEMIAELRINAEDMLKKYNELRDQKRRMEASIMDRGKAGEKVLSNLLKECKTQNIITDYKLQYELERGKIPDAIVDIDGIQIVVDSKAPNAPAELDIESRKEYISTLKGHIRQLSDKRYNASIEQQLFPTPTIMMLPGEGYLSVAYDKGKDSSGIHKFAKERSILIVGPHGLRTLLQLIKIWLEEEAANDRLNDTKVQENIATTLQPLWVEGILPFMKQSGNLLEKAVKAWNLKVDTIVEFDKVLRSNEILDLAPARKPQLPKKVSAPKLVDDSNDAKHKKQDKGNDE